MDKVVNMAYAQIVNDRDFRDRLDYLDSVAKEINREVKFADNIIQGVVLKLIDREIYNRYYAAAEKYNGLPESVTQCCARLLFNGMVANYYVCYLPYDSTMTDCMLTFPIKKRKMNQGSNNENPNDPRTVRK